MNREDIKVGDICILDESAEYSYEPEEPYEVIVLWHGTNGQPLVTRTNEYGPFWTTYSQLTTKVGRIDLEGLVTQSSRYPIEKWVYDPDCDKYRCPNCGEHAVSDLDYVKNHYKYCHRCRTELEV